MTREQHQDFLALLWTIEADEALSPNSTTRAICLLCRILLELGPEPLPTIHQEAR